MATDQYWHPYVTQSYLCSCGVMVSVGDEHYCQVMLAAVTVLAPPNRCPLCGQPMPERLP